MVYKSANQETSLKQLVIFLLGLLIDLEDGGITFHGKHGQILQNYIVSLVGHR
jgi:hypothetical protein